MIFSENFLYMVLNIGLFAENRAGITWNMAADLASMIMHKTEKGDS